MPVREPTEGAPRTVESETEAKQGVELHRVRYVLGISIVGAIVALGIVLLIFVL